MPRIAAVLGVFAVIAICIFVNTKRYPAVWEMVGSSPWFTQGANSSPKDSSPQPIEIAENDVSEQPSFDSQRVQEPLAPRTPPSLRPQISSHSNSVSDPQKDYSTSDSDDYPSYSPYTAESSTTESAKTPTYRGLNPGPIKIQGHMKESVASSDYPSDYSSKYTPDTSQDMDSTTATDKSDNTWPAEISPKMKYAAKPPLLESSQQLSNERPVVPIVRPKENKYETDSAKPDSNDSSENDPPKQSDSLVNDEDDTIVRRLPRIDPSHRAIHLSIPGDYPDAPIPIYPSTEQ